MWAVQFHPEVHHTPLGSDILRNFALNICGAKPSWTPQHFIDATVAQVRQQVGSGRAICALSGGVDSSVAAVLVDRAMRDASGKSRLTCVFVNNGVLRKNEFEKVQQNLRDHLGLRVVAVDATDASCGSWRESAIRKRSARSSATSSSRSLTTKHIASCRPKARRVAGAGDALSRRDRIALGARAVRGHQVAS